MSIQLGIIIFFYVATEAATLVIEYLNLRHLKKHGTEIPEEFQHAINAETLKKSRDYTFAKSKFGVVSNLYNQLIAIVFIFGGVLNYYNDILFNFQKDHNLPFAIWGLIFVMLLSYAKTILNIPFSLYNTFNLEKKFGFNTMTFVLWIVDRIKSLIISTVLISLLLLGAFWLIKNVPDLWWLPVWAFFFIFSLFIIYISPYVLEPLFNKFTPIEDKELAHEIKEMLKKAGIQIRGVYKMDASKRTKHSNAYFTGLGKVKRIVIFDTLLNKLSKEELLAVLAHEAGHCRKKHVFKNLMIFEALSAFGAYIAFLALQSDYLTTLFGLDQNTFFAKMMLLSFIASIILWGLPWFFNMVSRRFEREADDFAMNLVGSGKPLASALVKLSADNLSNIHPQKLYAMYHYSHPPELERVRALNAEKKQIII
jgi:STE24 endopeptidase